MAAKLAVAAITVVLLIAAAVQGPVSPRSTTAPANPSHTAPADILDDYLGLYRQAATVCPGLDCPGRDRIYLAKIIKTHGSVE